MISSSAIPKMTLIALGSLVGLSGCNSKSQTNVPPVPADVTKEIQSRLPPAAPGIITHPAATLPPGVPRLTVPASAAR